MRPTLQKALDDVYNCPCPLPNLATGTLELADIQLIINHGRLLGAKEENERHGRDCRGYLLTGLFLGVALGLWIGRWIF